MNEEEKSREPSRLKEGAEIETFGYSMRVTFHPEIRLDPKRGHDFSKTLSEIFVPTNTAFGSDLWEFVLPQGSTPQCFLAVSVSPSNFQLQVSHPEFKREWYETKFAMLLRRFHEFFKPMMVLQSSIMMQGLLAIDGDARDYLALQVGNMDPARIRPFGRPIQLLGLRFFFPPFKVIAKGKGKGKAKKTTENVTDWQINLRIESQLEDPKKLYIQADADWVKPSKWDEDAEKSILENLETVSDYMSKNVIGFLRHKPEPKQDT